MGETKPLYGNSASGIVDRSFLPEAILGQILTSIKPNLNSDQEIKLLEACEDFIDDKKIVTIQQKS